MNEPFKAIDSFDPEQIVKVFFECALSIQNTLLQVSLQEPLQESLLRKKGGMPPAVSRKERCLGLNVTMEQLGLVLKLLMDSHLVVTRNRTQLVQFFASHFHTRQSEQVSVQHLRNCYYHQERKTVTDLKNMLLDWLSVLKKMERSL